MLPAPPHKFTLIDLVLRAFIESTNALRFGYCAVDPDVELQQGPMPPVGRTARVFGVIRASPQSFGPQASALAG